MDAESQIRSEGLIRVRRECRSARRDEWESRGFPPLERPLLRPAPSSAIVFPLVVLLSILPGLLALNLWDLTPPGPLWGLRGLAVLEGMFTDQTPAADSIRPVQERASFRAVAIRPPLAAWLIALGFWTSADRDPLAAVLPSYVAGGLALILVHFHGRLWRGSGLAVIATLLAAFNQDLLLRIQQATPDTLGMLAASAALLFYGLHERISLGASGESRWSRPLLWAILGGISLGLGLLALGGAVLLVMPVVGLHRYFLAPNEPQPRGSSWARRRFFSLRDHPELTAAVVVLIVALGIAAPWYGAMIARHGWPTVLQGFSPRGLMAHKPRALASRLIELAPAILPLAIHGGWRSIRAAVVDEVVSRSTIGGSFWVLWFAVAALALSWWPYGPSGFLELFLLSPLCLLAATSIADLASRRAPVRALVLLVPACTVCVTWWSSAELSQAVEDVVSGHADAATALGLHLAFDLVVASIVIAWLLHRLTRRHDRLRRLILASFLLIVIAITIADGCREIVFRHSETNELLALRSMILRRDRESPFALVAVLSPSNPSPDAELEGFTSQRPSLGGRLRFILRTALPHLPQRDLESVDELDKLPEVERLVILVGAERGLSSATLARLKLESIHPGRSGILEAYASTHERRPRR